MKKEVVELCPNCGNEVVMEWNTDMDGFKAFCPHCGNRMMLCDECQHRFDSKYCADCDYDGATDSCRFNPAQSTKPSQTCDTVDAKTVRHGRWKTWAEAGNCIPSENRHECSECFEAAPVLLDGTELLSDYCPNCGAKMDRRW